MKMSEHPTVRDYYERTGGAPAIQQSPDALDAQWLRSLLLEAGADDVGFVEVGRPGLGAETDSILEVMPGARSLISFVCKMNRTPIRSTARSVANLEFHHVGDRVNEVARDVVSSLEALGVSALNPSMGFPMEMDRFPSRLWVVAHKTVAVEAGLGMMGIHRNVIHPKLGNFILLGTIITDAEITSYTRPVDYNPCLECKLCVAACPVGAISPEGDLNFSACYTHNYHEFMGNFTSWVEDIADSGSSREYRRRVTDSESASWWQSLSYGSNYKAAYCMAVCPAGEDVIGPFLTDRTGYLNDVVKPLQKKEEPIYVVPGSDPEAHVLKRYPHKTVRRVKSGLRPTSVRGFLSSLHFVFQPEQSAGLDATYHFTFTGGEEAEATIVIRDKTLSVEDGHRGEPDLRVTADSDTWIGFLRGDRSMPLAILSGKIRVKWDPRLLLAFGKCFPS